METIYLDHQQQLRAQQRNQAFWKGQLEEGPLLWITAPAAQPRPLMPEPASQEQGWTNVDYVIAAAESVLASTHYAGDALPVFCPWLGPDQFAAWLGSTLIFGPPQFTTWSKPFIHNWDEHPTLQIAPHNRWWRTYLHLVRESVRAGEGKWVTGYPDLHSGIDALRAIRGAELLAEDLVIRPSVIHRAMRQMTTLWKQVVDEVSAIILPAGQGTSNWTMGWSSDRFLCIGQNDYSCLISPRMFEEFCWEDNQECCNHVDHALYHLDGPGALRHLPLLLRLDRLDCIQWIQGAGQPLPSAWVPLLREMQAAGKSVQLYYGDGHGGDADLRREIDSFACALDPQRLFIWAAAKTAEQAEEIVRYSRSAFRKTHRHRPKSTLGEIHHD